MEGEQHDAAVAGHLRGKQGSNSAPYLATCLWFAVVVKDL